MRSLAIPVLLVLAAFARPVAAPAFNTSATPIIAARAVDPVGMFDYATVFQEQDATGAITVTSTHGKYGGEVTISIADQPMPITAVKVEENTVTIDSEAPDGPARMVLQFAGNDFTGEWRYAGMTGALKGKRRVP